VEEHGKNAPATWEPSALPKARTAAEFGGHVGVSGIGPGLGQLGSSPQGGQPTTTTCGVHSSETPDGPGASGTIRRDLTFVRLGLYYEVENQPESSARDGLPIRLARLIVVRDSRQFAEPGDGLMTIDTRADVRRHAAYIAGQLAKAGTQTAWRVRDEGGADAVTLTAESAQALATSLSRAAVGLSADKQFAGLVIEKVPLGILDEFTGPGVRRAEIIGVSGVYSGHLKLLSLAVAAPADDQFWQRVVSATQ
jgi:hypothetical protein